MDQVKTLFTYAMAYLTEVDKRDPIDYQKERALQAKRLLERAKIELDLLHDSNPGFTEGCEEVRDLYKVYTLYDNKIKRILAIPSPMNSYIALFQALTQAEEDIMRALEGKRCSQRALNSLNQAEMIYQNVKRKGQQIPETLIERITTLRGYSIQL